MSSIERHLGSNEKVIYRFRPSRRAFLGEYMTIVIIVGIIIALYNTKIMASLAYALAGLAVILLVKAEYKIWSKAYAITDTRIMISEGILAERFKSCVYGNITNIGLAQSFLERVLNTGTIAIDTSGSDRIELILRNISRPYYVKKGIGDVQAASMRLRQNTMYQENMPQNPAVHHPAGQQHGMTANNVNHQNRVMHHYGPQHGTANMHHPDHRNFQQHMHNGSNNRHQR